MTLALYAHPFSSYSQKALIAFYENATSFELKMLGPESPQNFEALKKLWPLGKFPVLDDDGAVVFEATSIIEHLALHYPGPVSLIPADPGIALDVRTMDRVFDNYVMRPMSWTCRMRCVHRRRETRRPLRKAARCSIPPTVGSTNARPGANGQLERRSAWLTAPRRRPFSMPIGYIPLSKGSANCAHIGSASRPSFARAVDEAQPYRRLFPLGAPDRD